MKKTIKLLKALSETQRLRILALLFEKELCVCEINEIIGFSPATISQHLSILSEAGLLKTQKVQKWVFYSIDWDSMDESTKQILNLVISEIKKDLTILKDLEELKKTNLKSTCLTSPRKLDEKRN
jgi:ArsR family transcriptional regulator